MSNIEWGGGWALGRDAAVKMSTFMAAALIQLHLGKHKQEGELTLGVSVAHLSYTGEGKLTYTGQGKLTGMSFLIEH